MFKLKEIYQDMDFSCDVSRFGAGDDEDSKDKQKRNRDDDNENSSDVSRLLDSVILSSLD